MGRSRSYPTQLTTAVPESAIVVPSHIFNRENLSIVGTGPADTLRNSKACLYTFRSKRFSRVKIDFSRLNVVVQQDLQDSFLDIDG